MGLFDSVLGGLLGNSPLQSALSSILTGAGGGSGLPGLVEQFERAGLGHIVNSWIGSGPNQPVSPGALGQVFGQQQVQQWAQQAGVSQDDLLAELSRMLPHAVDQATPAGTVDQAAEAPSPSSPFDDPGFELPKG